MLVGMTNSNIVERELARRFDPATARHLVDRFNASTLPITNNDNARVHLAILLLAKGDGRRVLRELAEAEKDWRDTLCAAGMEHANWRDVVRAAGLNAPP